MTKFWKKIIFSVVVSTAIGIMAQNILVAMASFAILAILSSIPIYIKYAQDNPKHLWFKRKLFGWGWTPVTWQGWLVIAVYIGLVVLFSLTIDESSPPREIAFTFILPVAALTVLLIRIAYRTGETPRWQWGKDLDKYE